MHAVGPRHHDQPEVERRHPRDPEGSIADLLAFLVLVAFFVGVLLALRSCHRLETPPPDEPAPFWDHVREA